MAYTMDDLCAEVGIPARTVRYYIQYGLIAPPAPRGRHTVYDELTAARLRAIRSLRAAGMALDGIKFRMEGLSIAELASLAAHPPDDTTRPVAIPPSAARETIPMAVPTTAREGKTGDAPTAQAPPVRRGRPKRETPVAPPPATAPSVNHGPRAPEQWARLVLVPGLELHLRAESGPLVERLAQEIFAKFSVPAS